MKHVVFYLRMTCLPIQPLVFEETNGSIDETPKHKGG